MDIPFAIKDLFFKLVGYLPIKDIKNLCHSHPIYRKYCIDPQYYGIWKNFLYNEFKSIAGYQDIIVEIQKDLQCLDNFSLATKMAKK